MKYDIPNGLPPISIPPGKRTEGTLLTNRSTIKRAPKSKFLKQLEKAQAKLLHPEVRAQLSEEETARLFEIQTVRITSPGVTLAGQRLREALKPASRNVTLLNSYRKRRNP